MAKVKGPLHSDSASGAVGKNITFRHSKNGSVVTGFYFPGSFKKVSASSAQILQRTKYRLGLDLWNSLPQEEKEYWNLLILNGVVII